MDLPIENGESFHSFCKRLPEGKICWATYMLIGGLEHFLFSHILGIITPTVGGLEHVIFSHSVGKVIIRTDFHSMIFQIGRSTTNQIIINHIITI